MPSSILYRLRSTLADPPGACAADPERRATYRAALTQFEQLLDAARATGSAARPLPLYYALPQAGRAIVACRGGEPGNLHGLGLDESSVKGLPLDAVVQPKDDGPKGTKRGWFHAVAETTDSPLLAGDAPLGSLMSSLPELARPLGSGSWPPASYVGIAFGMEASGAKSLGPRYAIELRPEPSVEAERADLTGGAYPRLVSGPWRPAVGVVQTLADRSLLLSDQGEPVGLRVPHLLDDLAPQYRWTDRRWVRPDVVGGAAPNPLMTWWAVLFALSMLARYHPETWVAALDRYSATTPTVLEQALDVALEAIPHVVLEAISGKSLLVTPGPDDPPTTL